MLIHKKPNNFSRLKILREKYRSSLTIKPDRRHFYEMSLTCEPSSDWVERHRSIWKNKPSLRFYYRSQIFNRIIAEIVTGRTLQLGSGPGFFNNCIPNMVNTDYGNRFNIALEVDAHYLPFNNQVFANIVGIDVLHHFYKPGRVLKECMRTLEPGGRLILIEPWAGYFGNLFYKFVHHEDCEDVENVLDTTYKLSNKLPMEGNSKIPRIIFGTQILDLKKLLPEMDYVKIEYFGCLSFLLTGGFQEIGSPSYIIKLMIKLEKLLTQRIKRHIALRAMIVLQKK